MKKQRLWVSNRNGNVFTISCSDLYISQLMKTYAKGVRIKRLAASDWCAWSIGHDHRVYVHVIATDVPIRVPETTYENQRWKPLMGFRSSNLLPTDRKAWSDEKGEVYLPKESIRLPSAHWEWEGDWFIDENLQGDICTDSGGWQYAVNFTGKWTAESTWTSCVRKRKWIRFCRFTATNTWARVCDLEVADNRECFIDLSVGGQLLPGQPPDFLSVWATTNSGQVYIRTGVCRDSPEGINWQHIACPSHDMGIINIACGPTGLVWAITWDGHAIVRTHVSRDAVYGTGWEVVPYPEESTRLMQVSVGRNSVWALSRDGKVWFRQGVNGDKLFWDATAATGTAWVLMVGEMDHIAVSANDQVFALGQDDEDKEIWFRTGITPSEPGGKTWQRVILEESPDVFDPNSPGCLLSRASQPSLESPDDVFAMSDVFNSDQAPAFPKEVIKEMLLEDGTSLQHFDSSSESFPDVRDEAEEGQEGKRISCDSIRSWQMVETAVKSSVTADSAVEAVEDVDDVDGGELFSQPYLSPSLLSDSANRTVRFMDSTTSENTPTVGGTETENEHSVSGTRKSTGKRTQNSVKKSSGNVVQKSSEKVSPVHELDSSVSDKTEGGGGGDVSKAEENYLGTENKRDNRNDRISRDSSSVTNKNKKAAVTAAQTEQTATKEIAKASSLSPAKINRLSSRDSDVDPGVLNSSFHSDTFDSLDSGPSSDVICNFVTDLISDEEDEKASAKSRSKSDLDQQDDKSADPGRVTFQDMHDQTDHNSSDKLPPVIPWVSLGSSENFTGQSPGSFVPFSRSWAHSAEKEPESIPAMTLTLAQPRYAWGWLAAGAFVVENPSAVPWLSATKGSDSKFQYSLPKVSRELRDNILQQLKLRNLKETHAFSTYEHAVEKTTWVKKATMKVNFQGKEHHCTLEMEQGVKDALDGTLTIQFKLKHKPKVIQMSLQDIRCVKMCDDHRMALYTNETETSVHPLTLITSSEAELREWLGVLNTANSSLWKINAPIPPGSVCSLTIPGHVFVHVPDDTRANPIEMMWGLHGGHMGAIETTPCGVIWAISFDLTPWVYNGGYGNAFTRELSEVASSLREQVDYRTIRVYENQKWFPLVGYCSRGVFKNNFAWTTPRGKYVKSREDIKLPSSQWQWVSDWTVDFTTPGGVNNDGWQFSSQFYRPYHPSQGLRDSVRRRQWSRKCKLVTQGPWINVGPPELTDISLQVDTPSSPTQPLLLWAIGANGNVLRRSDVTLAEPMGKSWIHVATKSDMPFKSVSVGGRNRVWAIAVDGSVWYRAGVTPLRPEGSDWIQVIPPPPGGAMLSSISVGGTAVWAVDKGGDLWRREEITPTFPEGTRWMFICNHVRKVSVGPKDQVWIVSEANFGRSKHSGGALYRRLGITEDTPSGTDWELVIGPGWHHVSIRGLMTPNK